MKNKRNIIIYFLEMLIVFLIIDFLVALFSGAVAASSLFSKYGTEVIMEVFYAFAILIVMLLFDNSYVFTEKKSSFFSGIKLAIPMMAISLFNFINSLIHVGKIDLSALINVIVFCLFVGIAEEFLCRGWLQNEFIERFSKNKKEIIISIVLSSLIFGFMHIVNVSSQTLFETIMQIINAASIGVLLGSIYFKTKNIWSVIFLHAFYDFSIMFAHINLVKNCSYNTPTLAVSIYESFGTLLVSLLWILGAIYVLNKCDFNKSVKHNNKSLLIYMGIVFMIIFLPINRYIPGYENYKVCYTYKEMNKFDDYTIHYPNKKIYIIEYTTKDFSTNELVVEKNYKFNISKSNNEIIIKNMNTSYEKAFKFNDIKGYEVFETNNKYNIVIWTSENESTLYVSDSITKIDINDNASYIDNIIFEKYVFPKISKIGYIDNGMDIYTYALSNNNDEFVIINKELFVIKKEI